jgi:putative membrane protein
VSEAAIPVTSVTSLPSQWARLHPLSPVARGSRAIVALALVGGRSQVYSGGTDPSRLYVDLAVAVVAVIAGVLSWLVTRWRVEGGELQVETGLLRRQSIRVPLARVQAVDVVRPLAARLLGISELRLVLAGRGTGKARLSFLPQERAVEVRAQLLALAHGLAGDTPEAPERPIAAVPNRRLVMSTLLGVPVTLAAIVVPLLVVLAVLAPQSVGPTSGALVTSLLGAGAATLRRLNVEFSFFVAESPDGLRLRSGLLQTRSETIPFGRVQAVRLLEPLLWRPFGWCRLEVDVAQQREREAGETDSRQLTRALLPVGSRADAEQLLARVLPGADLTPPAGSAPPRRARAKAPLSFHLLAAWYNPTYAVTRTGRLRPETVVVPLAKVQSVRWTQGPVQRRLRLATVRVDTAGRRWRAQARDRDAEQANELVSLLVDAARASRAAPRTAPAAHVPVKISG